jgi:cytoskeletal protein CcmA (bactofilin family)
MAIFGESNSAPGGRASAAAAPDPVRDAAAARAASDAAAESRRARSGAEPALKESLIAAELAIEGRIQGAGNVRIAGRFKGDVNVDGNVTIEPGSHLEGAVTARTVIIAGELHGNVAKAKHVDVLQTGVVVGDIVAETVAVAGGARMCGHVQFGVAESAARPVSSAAQGIANGIASGTVGTAQPPAKEPAKV